jgi:2-dehydro-3-deoxyphosphogluconate aldolase/(4S)-4-hydroxy-2-oxoglutarate aldolase
MPMTSDPATDLTAALSAAPVLGIVRAGSVADGVRFARGFAEGGLRAIEISLTSKDALVALAEAQSDLPGSARLGIGTVRTAQDAEAAIGAGAHFLVSPNYSAAVVSRARDAGIPIVCGVLTPTEIQMAADDGVQWLKIFPAGSFGPSYIRDLRAPFPELRFVPTGGIGIDDLPAFRAAGAAAIALAGALTGRDDGADGGLAAARTALRAWGAVDDH